MKGIHLKGEKKMNETMEMMETMANETIGAIGVEEVIRLPKLPFDLASKKTELIAGGLVITAGAVAWHNRAKLVSGGKKAIGKIKGKFTKKETPVAETTEEPMENPAPCDEEGKLN